MLMRHAHEVIREVPAVVGGLLPRASLPAGMQGECSSCGSEGAFLRFPTFTLARGLIPLA